MQFPRTDMNGLLRVRQQTIHVRCKSLMCINLKDSHARD